MDELWFRVIYAVVGAAFIAALLFSLGRKLNRKTYLLPIVVGAAITALLVIIPTLFSQITASVIPLLYLLGGVLTGYLVKDAAVGWTGRFRAGGTGATLVLAVLFIPNTYVMIAGTTFGLFTSPLQDILNAINTAAAAAGSTTVAAEDLLYYLLGNYIFTGLFIIAFVGLGAILGGYLRRILKPAEKKEEAPVEPAAQPPAAS